MKLPTLLSAALAAALLAPSSTAQNLLANPSFESGLTGWIPFGNVFPQTASPPQFEPHSGNGLVSMFGNFSGDFNVSGIFQEFPALPGDDFFMDAYSRHWSGDALTGTGAADFNWVVMKIAFFDGFGSEITSAASEATILDGTFATDQWFDHAPIAATAPAGVATVQALILFLQPAFDGGAAHIDDVFFGPGTPVPTYPGGGEDVRLATAVGGGLPTSGAGNDIKTAMGGDLLEINVSSPGGTFDLAPYLLICQTFATGFPPTTFPGLPDVYINPTLPYFVLVNVKPSPIGSPVIAPGVGDSSFFVMPPGLSGISLMLQAFPFSSAALNTVFAASDGHEIQLQ